MSEQSGGTAAVPASALGDGSASRGLSPSDKLFAKLGNDFQEPSTIDDAIGDQGGLGGADEGEPSVEDERAARGQGTDEEEPEPELGEEPGEDDYLPEGKGSRDNPLTVKDLPQDKFIKVKVDGKEEIVDLRDAVSGYIRTQAFDRMTSKVNANLEEALTITRQAVEERATFRQNFLSFCQDPKRLHAHLAEHFPETVREMAHLEAQRFAEEKANPGVVEQRRLAAERRRLEAERAAWEEQQQSEHRTRAEREATARLQAAIAPGYNAGIKEAGLVGVKLTPEFVDTVKALAAPLQKRGDLDADSMRAIVLRAAKLVPQASVKDRRPVAAPPAPARQPAQRQRGKDWGAVPAAERLRDPDFFLRRTR